MPTLGDSFDGVYTKLRDQFRAPPDNFEELAPFEAMIAVSLDRAAGLSVARAGLEALAEDDLLAPDQLARADVTDVLHSFREKGLTVPPRVLAALKHLALWLLEHDDSEGGSLRGNDGSAESLRDSLAGVNGISVAGADALILHALMKPTYPVDRATFRVLVRHGWLDATASYEEAREIIVDPAVSHAERCGKNAANLLADLAFGMEQLGRRYCRVGGPRCNGCALESFLPAGGALEIDA
jgi:endonuclease-3 related protein